jgi:hypothetical protein
MKIALTVSVILNLVLGALLLTRSSGAGGPKPLPANRPDFASVEKAVNEVLSRKEFATLLELKSVRKGKWLCQVTIRHRVPENIGKDWPMVEQFVKKVQDMTGLPGRVAGNSADEKDMSRITGSICEFGYSYEVGYDCPNEFSGRAAGK